jgi:hypothetical protein
MDMIGLQVKCNDCLWKMVSERDDKKMKVLLYFVVKHWQDVEFFHHQYNDV